MKKFLMLFSLTMPMLFACAELEQALSDAGGKLQDGVEDATGATPAHND